MLKWINAHATSQYPNVNTVNWFLFKDIDHTLKGEKDKAYSTARHNLNITRIG